jgi:hypothetical protein
VTDDRTVPPWKTTDSQLIYAHPDLCLFEYQIIRRDGVLDVRHRLAEPALTRVIAVDQDGLLAFVWHWSYGLGYPAMELPSAAVDDPEEDPLTAAQRALREGCGLAAQDWTRIGKITAATEVAVQVVHLYLAERPYRVPQPAGEGERLAFAMPYGVAVSSAVTGAVEEAASVAALLVRRAATTSRRMAPARPATPPTNQAVSGLMVEFVYRAGMATGRHRDERRAYLKAFGGNLKIERVKRGLSQEENRSGECSTRSLGWSQQLNGS